MTTYGDPRNGAIYQILGLRPGRRNGPTESG